MADQRNRGAREFARVHGTEDDKINCPYYLKMGACRHGDTCQRKHLRPAFSQTILVKHMWTNPMVAVINSGGNAQQMDQARLQEDLDNFFEDVFEEMRKYGEVEDVQVMENLCDHMVGNVYIKFADEEMADAALQAVQGRFYSGRQLEVEFSPVTDFSASRCRQFDEDFCGRESLCNFMHVREPSRSLRTYLEAQYGYKGGRTRGVGNMSNMNRGRAAGPGGARRENNSRSRSRDRDAGGRGGGRDRGRRDSSRSRDRDSRR